MHDRVSFQEICGRRFVGYIVPTAAVTVTLWSNRCQLQYRVSLHKLRLTHTNASFLLIQKYFILANTALSLFSILQNATVLAPGAAITNTTNWEA